MLRNRYLLFDFFSHGIRSTVTLALTVLTSSQAILIVWSKRAGKYEYSVTTANFLVRKWISLLRINDACQVNELHFTLYFLFPISGIRWRL